LQRSEWPKHPIAVAILTALKDTAFTAGTTQQQVELREEIAELLLARVKGHPLESRAEFAEWLFGVVERLNSGDKNSHCVEEDDQLRLLRIDFITLVCKHCFPTEHVGNVHQFLRHVTGRL
jgi:hypothetical protein